MVLWLRFHASNAGGKDSIPGQGTKIPQAVWHGQKKKQKLKKKKKNNIKKKGIHLFKYRQEISKNYAQSLEDF